jgi:hypothetical protein
MNTLGGIIKNIGLALVIFSFGIQAFAGGGDVCFVGEGSVTDSHRVNDRGAHMLVMKNVQLENIAMSSGPQCKDLRSFTAALDAADFTFYITSAGMACTGVGATASLVVFGVGVVLHGLNFIVKNLPCESGVSDQVIEQRVEKRVCEVLGQNGFDCKRKLRR